MKKHPFSLANLFADNARRNPDLRFYLSSPMDVAPQLGSEVKLARLATLVDEIAERMILAGIRPGDRVAIAKRPSSDVTVIQQAVAKVGGIPAMIWPYADPEILSMLISRLDLPWLVTDSTVKTECFAKVPLDRITFGILELTDEGWSAEKHGSFRNSRSGLNLPEGAVLITHSSGTTGVPKLMVFNDAALGAHTKIQERVARWLSLRGPVAFCLSYFHNRMPSALATALDRRAEIILLDDPNPVVAADLMSKIKPQVVETFPNVYIEWEGLANHSGRPLANIRLFINTFDAVHPRTVKTMLSASERRCALHLQAYGATETGPLAIRLHTRRSASAGDDFRCVGYSIPGLTKNRLVQRLGTNDSITKSGEIQVKAKGAALAYVNEPNKQAPGSPENWWGTGDVGKRGRFGCLHLLDRAVDEIPGGSNNLILEDKLLTRMPELREVIVIPSTDGKTSVPVVATRNDHSLNIHAWREATADMPYLGRPLHLMWDAIPRSSTWKVRRISLQEQITNGEIRPIAATEA